MEWAPADCTLPTVERPLRVAEFDALFATALRGAERRSPTLLRLRLDGSGQAELITRDLATRESACCSFFTFSFAREGGDLLVDVEVPRERVAVLDALASRAGA
ncbi:hypothetical protein [Microbispora sp. NPDC049125]|uniref:hypothetical protein n=1 Tax=Microbispora sp. NPDC049125 TaxID=3154929 RepID=UPI003467B516